MLDVVGRDKVTPQLAMAVVGGINELVLQAIEQGGWSGWRRSRRRPLRS